MNCLIVEDEPHAAEHLRYLLGLCRQKPEISAQKDSVKQAVLWLKNNEPDLCFIDIQLGDDLAFSIFDNVQLNCPVIFTTSYDTYAIQAFKQNSIAYLLKPIGIDELQEALNKYEKYFTPAPVFREISRKFHPTQSRFLVQSGNILKSIKAEEIAFFYVKNRFVFLTTLKGESFLFDSTLDSLELRLDPTVFFRINRQVILSVNAIQNMQALNRGRILIETNPPSKEEMIVSIERSSLFKDWLNK